jgi:hypothetical protein
MPRGAIGTGGEVMRRRSFLQTLTAGSLATLFSMRFTASSAPDTQILKSGRRVALKCLGIANGPRWLDGRTSNGTVGLAPKMGVKQFSGTQWQVVRRGDGVISLKCLGLVEGPRWLDGRTANGTVGLAPGTAAPFTGTAWQVVDGENNTVTLKCLGKVEGNRWLDGRTGNGSVGLAPRTDSPFTGTKWEVQSYPVCIDEPCP